MSCFIIEHDQIDAILTFYVKATNRSDQDMTAAGQHLVNENTRAYNVRYRDNEKADKYTFKRTQPISAVQCLKYAQCVEYNSFEDSKYKDSEAHMIIQNIMGAAIRRIDGYDKAGWSVR